MSREVENSDEAPVVYDERRAGVVRSQPFSQLPERVLRGRRDESARHHVAGRELVCCDSVRSSLHPRLGVDVGTADDEHGPPAVVQHAARDAAEQRAGEGSVAARADDDQVGIDRCLRR